MDEETKETQDAYTEDDKTSENEVNEADEDVESLKAKIAEMEKTIKTLSIQKKKAQEKNAKVEEKKPLETEEILSIKERLDLRDFRDAHPDLDTEDIVEINQVAKANNLKLDEALSLPIVKGYLNNKQEQKKIETATIEINRAPKGADNKPLFYEGQSDEEFKKNWLQYMSKQT